MIRSRWVSWLSIIVIAMLATAAFLGIIFSEQSMKDSASAYYNAQRFEDIRLISSGMFTEEDLETLRNTEGVAGAEGVLSIPTRVSSESVLLDVALQTGTEEICTVEWIDGLAPAAMDECAVEEILADKMGWKIGDTVELKPRDSRTDMLIRSRTLKITGIFRTADHLSDIIQEDWLIQATPEAFRTDYLNDGNFNRIRIRVSDVPDDRFSSEYEERVDEVRKGLPQNDGWVITDLRENINYIFFKGISENLGKISYSFSLLFIVIAMLVIYSSIGRMVEQDSKLVGAKKAMGLKNSEVLAKYLVYGNSATAAGVVLGFLAAYFILLRFIVFGFGVVFLFTERVYSILPLLTVMVAVGALVLSTAAVWLACSRLFKSTAVTLMQGTKPAAGKVKAGKSDNRSLYLRLIFRNMWNERRRVLVTIVSIAGCCSLVLIGFSLRFSVSRVLGRQYGQIMHYDLEAAMDFSSHPEAEEEADEILTGMGVLHTCAWVQNVLADAGGEKYQVTFICMDEERLSEFFTLTDSETGKQLSLSESGILIPRRMMETSGLHAGDTLTVYDSVMDKREIPIAGVFDNYLALPVFCSPETAEEIQGGPLMWNTILISSGGNDQDTLREQLKTVEGFQSLSSAETYREMFGGFSLIMNLVIMVMSMMAVMIACFILLNLVNTYVISKTRELTIMRINGFTTRETIWYASLESYGSTVAGILLGLGVGWLLSSIIIRSLDQLYVKLVHDPHWISFAVSILITAVISLVIHFMSFRKIRDLKMSDIQ